LVAATATAAALLGLDDRGRIEAGRRADLVVVSGNPYEFATHRERVTRVYKNGVLARDNTSH
jgi:imidazolonepropionase-like amidohydrolase